MDLHKGQNPSEVLNNLRAERDWDRPRVSSSLGDGVWDVRPPDTQPDAILSRGLRHQTSQLDRPAEAHQSAPPGSARLFRGPEAKEPSGIKGQPVRCMEDFPEGQPWSSSCGNSSRGCGGDALEPEVSPELEALVAKHAPQELHLLKPCGWQRRVPRRGPRLSDLLEDDFGGCCQLGFPPQSEQKTSCCSEAKFSFLHVHVGGEDSEVHILQKPLIHAHCQQALLCTKRLPHGQICHTFFLHCVSFAPSRGISGYVAGIEVDSKAVRGARGAERLDASQQALKMPGPGFSQEPPQAKRADYSSASEGGSPPAASPDRGPDSPQATSHHGEERTAQKGVGFRDQKVPELHLQQTQSNSAEDLTGSRTSLGGVDDSARMPGWHPAASPFEMTVPCRALSLSHSRSEGESFLGQQQHCHIQTERSRSLWKQARHRRRESSSRTLSVSDCQDVLGKVPRNLDSASVKQELYALRRQLERIRSLAKSGSIETTTSNDTCPASQQQPWRKTPPSMDPKSRLSSAALSPDPISKLATKSDGNTFELWSGCNATCQAHFWSCWFSTGRTPFSIFQFCLISSPKDVIAYCIMKVRQL